MAVNNITEYSFLYNNIPQSSIIIVLLCNNSPMSVRNMAVFRIGYAVYGTLFFYNNSGKS